MKALIKTAAVIIVIALIVDIAASLYFYNLAIARTKKDFLIQNTTQKQVVPASAEVGVIAELSSGSEVDAVAKFSENAKLENQTAWFDKHTYEEVGIISEDGLKLKGYYLNAKIHTSKTVILAHGYSSQGTFMGSYAELYNEKFGYNVLLPDDRGHGNSEGNYTGFGWVDRKDYLKWIDFVINKLGQDSQIILHGVSMGGSTVLMTSGEKLPEKVKAIISDCAYTSVKDELEYQLKEMYNLPSFPILSTTSILTKLRAGYFFGEASALEQVKKSKTPTLFIHGAADKFVPFYMVNQLYEACNSEKDLLVVPNAGHGAAYNTDSEGYKNKVSEFLGKYVK
ncbi:MAG: alpha/beta hydrolase [Ruminiclostridium sp.]